ncbi:MAG: hypothetical protein FJZ00_14800 [Candidatus Sericytochromatia bacterium]|uniref:Co-chaperone DjlA N-terminal domain-containing protein n=1 Tax=Candidatus Tanganyikabacteria bacterium TaxID=2961651 RepID=A0A937XA74_9BACT|nr:hypothetical protein [Candidatus Tanganyikabacteria bacterium]
MYLAELTRDQKSAFIALARQLVVQDQSATHEEIEALRQLAAELAGADLSAQPGATDNLETTFATDRSRVIALLELLRLAYSDGGFDQGEIHLVVELAKKFQVSMSRLREIDAWVRQFVALMRKCDETILAPPWPARGLRRDANPRLWTRIGPGRGPSACAASPARNEPRRPVRRCFRP